jgi:serine/threonine protein phosphatase PrpC
MSVCTDSRICRRTTNEDEGIVVLYLYGKYIKLNPKNIYFVFDGHGGNNMVSKFLENNFLHYFLQNNPFMPNIHETEEFQTYFLDCCNQIQNKLRFTFNKISEHCGSTALMVIHHLV